ncbi:uncharacterized protein O3C94_013218 isoform 2-T2 [Discoglossus pictus]
MGTGMCSRRQKSLLHTGFCLLAVLGLGSAAFLYNYLLQKANTSQALAMKFKQQQETLSAQLQDFLVYKLEAQEALNKEKQDSMNRYGALGSQHKILKNQHEDLKKQLADLQAEHSNLKLEHRKALETNSQKVSQLQRDRDYEIIGLQDTISKLKEERKLLRKAHQDIHTQLLGAQAQMDEFRKLKNTLRKMPSFNNPSTEIGNLPPAGSNSKVQLDNTLLQNQRLSERLNPPQLWTQNDSVSHVARFTRTVNSLQSPKEDRKEVTLLQLQQPKDTNLQKDITHNLPGVLGKEPTMNAPSVHEQVPIQSWQDIVNKVNAKMSKEEEGNDAKHEAHHAIIPAANWGREVEHRAIFRKAGNVDELEMDAGMIDREDNLQSQKQQVEQQPVIPDDAADPAQDPNNQGEDEFEEAEIDRPEFEKVVQGAKEVILQVAVKKPEVPEVADKSREEPEDHYQEDQEQDIEEHGVDPDTVDELVQDHKEGPDTKDTKNRHDEYY